MKVGFELVMGEIAKGRMSAFGVIIGEIMADFQARFAQTAEAAAVEYFNFEAAPKGFGVGVVVAVALPGTTAPAHALPGPVPRQQVLETRGRVLAALVGVHEVRWSS